MTQGAASEIVLLPGLDGSGDLFERLARLLRPHLNVTIIRYPSDAKMTYADYVRFVVERIGARPVVLLGESFSGPVAVLVAATPGTNVRGLVLAATFLKSPWPGWLVRFVAHRVPPLASRPLLNWILMGRRRDPELSAKMKEVLSRLPPAVRVARLEAVSRVDVERLFRDGHCPALVLCGKHDWLVPGSVLAAAARERRLPCDVHGFDAEHLVLQIAADDAAQRIRAFSEKATMDNSGGANAS